MTAPTQLEYWNGPTAQRWIAGGEQLDRGIAGVTAALMERAAARPGERVLDVGCGCGTTTLLLAERVGTGGDVEGVDISAPMLEVARTRGAALGVRFTEADATTHELRVPVDLVFSRFGVMFFADPVAAFDNLRRALAPGGRVVFACWRAPEQNAWATVPLAAARDLLPPAPPPDPDAPGPFAFADESRLRGILSAAGFRHIDVARHDDTMYLGATAADAAAYTLTIGPLSRAASEQPAPVRQAILVRVAAALASFVTPDGVAPPASVWLVTAR
jgi:SAM-dependent methyltransferase